MSMHEESRLRALGTARIVALACVAGLIGLGIAWELWLARLPGGHGTLALKVLPLTLTVAGLLKHRLYTYRWTSLLVWLYVSEALLRMTSETGRVVTLSAVELLLSLGLFAACGFYVRLRLAGSASA